MVLIESLIKKVDAISGVESTEEFKGFIESNEVSVIKSPKQDITEYDPYEFLIGSVIELEHTNDVLTAMNIACNHLDEIPDYYSQLLDKIEKDFDAKKLLESAEFKEYQVAGSSNINVARMIKNMSKVHVPKFDTKRNINDRFKALFKIPTPKDDMNAANSNREAFEKNPTEEKTTPPVEKVKPIETKGLDNDNFSIVGVFIDEKEASDVLKNLLMKKRNAKMGQNKDGRFEVTVEEGYIPATPENGIGHVEGGKEYIPNETLMEDNTMGNSSSVVGTVLTPVSNVKKKKE